MSPRDRTFVCAEVEQNIKLQIEIYRGGLLPNRNCPRKSTGAAEDAREGQQQISIFLLKQELERKRAS